MAKFKSVTEVFFYLDLPPDTQFSEQVLSACLKKLRDVDKYELLEWVKQKIPQRNITNFNTSWEGGQALIALVEKINPGKFNFNSQEFKSLGDVLAFLK